MNELSTRLSLSQYSQHHSATRISMTSYIYSASSWSQHAYFTLCQIKSNQIKSNQTIL